MVSMSSEYNRKYFEENKEKIMEQLKKSQEKSRIRKLVKQLNNNEYKRIPYSKIDKYNIKFNDETQKYYIE